MKAVYLLFRTWDTFYFLYHTARRKIAPAGCTEPAKGISTDRWIEHGG